MNTLILRGMSILVAVGLAGAGAASAVAVTDGTSNTLMAAAAAAPAALNFVNMTGFQGGCAKTNNVCRLMEPEGIGW